MARNARYEPGLDLWSLSFSQLTGYLGTNQCVSERVSEFIYLGVSPRPALWPSVGHTQHHNGNQGNGINWGGGRGEKKKKEKHHMWTSSPAVIQHHEILYFPFPCRNMSRQVLTNWRPRNRKWNTHSARFLINSTSRCPSLCCQKWLQSTFNMCDFILVSMALCFFFFLLKGT